jgi:hypothetical protein
MAGDWWDLVPAITGAIVGAASAAIPAWLLARSASRETLERDRAQRSDAMRLSAYRAFVKMQLIANRCGSVRIQIEQMVAAADNSGHAALPIWQKVRPLIGFAVEPVSFEADDLALFVSARQFDFIGRLLLVAERYNALIECLKLYDERRTLVTDRLGASMNGIVGAVNMNAEEVAWFAPRSAELTSLMQQIRNQATEYAAEAMQAASDFGPTARITFPDFPILVAGQA